MDFVVRRAIEEGIEPVRAIRMATINPAVRFGLDRRGWGAVSPGFRADFLITSTLEDFRPEQVYIAGRRVAVDGDLTIELPQPPPAPGESLNIGWKDFQGLDIPAEGDRMRVIGLTEGQITTESLKLEPKIVDGCAVSDTGRDLIKLGVVERHHATGNVGLGFVKGLGLQDGAIASSVAHDSHNIIVAGANDEDMLAAVRAIENAGGGQVAVADGEVIAMLKLPIAGLMSDRPLQEVTSQVQAIHKAAAALGASFSQPFMALSFLALPVIPSLRLTDRGLVDVEAFAPVDLWSD